MVIEYFNRVKDFIVDFFSKKYTVYSYFLTINGWIEPPEQNRRKNFYSPLTTLQFEISFEDVPYFRCMANENEINEFIKSIINDIKKSAEYICSVNKAFTYYIELPKGQIPIIEFVRDVTRYEFLKLDESYYVKVSTIPIFHVKNFSAKLMGKFLVSERILKKFEAIDTATVRVFRPDEIEPYFEFKFEYLHPL